MAEDEYLDIDGQRLVKGEFYHPHTRSITARVYYFTGEFDSHGAHFEDKHGSTVRYKPITVNGLRMVDDISERLQECQENLTALNSWVESKKE